ncbi:MAG: N-acetylgalactosamine-6-sulfatase, partial [Flavobacteriaceae bacterium]|nr:N-acetylgalactosamine-6-sulfatase [Flavobacteriaceae bacterium]
KATYAAMISYLDEQVGELVSVLKETGQYENTIIIFTSDNGPSYVQPLDLNYFESTGFLNNHPQRVKGKVYEGGIRVPMIVHWPRNIKEKRVSNHISSFQDFYATVLDLLKLNKPNYIDGLSYLPTLLNNKQPKHEYLYWEFASRGGQQALRYGKWKAIKTNLQKANDNFELFDLEKDPKELYDISINHPDVVKKIEKILIEARTRPALKNFYLKSLDSD